MDNRNRAAERTKQPILDGSGRSASWPAMTQRPVHYSAAAPGQPMPHRTWFGRAACGESAAGTMHCRRQSEATCRKCRALIAGAA